MGSHTTRNWVDIANAARELLTTAAARLAETRQHSTGAAFDDGYDAALTELLAHPHADRLRTLLLTTVDATHGRATHVEHLLSTALAYQATYAGKPTDDPYVQTQRDANDAEVERLRTLLGTVDATHGQPTDEPTLTFDRAEFHAYWQEWVTRGHEPVNLRPKERALVGGRSAAPDRDRLQDVIYDELLPYLANPDAEQQEDLEQLRDNVTDAVWRLVGGVAAGAPGEQEQERVRVDLTRDDLDGGYVAECVNLPGCVSQGDTVPEALVNLADAYAAIKGGVAAEPNEEPTP